MKDMIQVKVSHSHLDRNSDEQLMQPAAEVLNFVIKKNLSNRELKNYKILKLIRHEIKRVDDLVKERDIVLAEAIVSDIR